MTRRRAIEARRESSRASAPAVEQRQTPLVVERTIRVVRMKDQRSAVGRVDRTRVVSASFRGKDPFSIRREIAEVESGRFTITESPLRHAPHTVHDLVVADWDRKYSREEGCFPEGTARVDKYWSPVSRIDNVYGDRNLICSCVPIEDYAEAMA